jgi:hypothetical protein
MTGRSRLAAIAVAAAVALVCVPSALADVLADGSGVRDVRAWGGVVTYARQNASDHLWQLMAFQAGAERALPVAPRSAPFDLDAGSDAAGHPVVTWSRCATYRSATPLGDRGCRLWMLRLDDPAATPARLRTGLPAHWSATHPSMSRGELAFAAYLDRGDHSRVMLLRRGARRPVALARLHVGCELDCDDRTIYSAVSDLDLGARAVALRWTQTGGDVVGVGDQNTLQVDPRSGAKAKILSVGYVSGACGYVDPESPTADGLGAFYIAAGSRCSANTTSFALVDPSRSLRSAAAPPAGTLIESLTRDATGITWLRATCLTAARDDYGNCPADQVHRDIVHEPLPALAPIPRGKSVGPHPG